MAITRYILIFLFLWTVTGCANSISNLEPALLTIAPKVQTYRDPSFNTELYKTFSVLPYSDITKEKKLNPILEKQMLFALRNIIEGLGYLFVNPDKSPDLLITIDSSMDYKEFDIPARQIYVPRWVPDQEIRTVGKSSGYISGIGSYGGPSTVTTTVPGYYANETYIVPGYTTGSYYPGIIVAAYDHKTAANVWWGAGVGESKNNDIRVASQLVLLQLVGGNFPKSKYYSELTLECKGEEGLLTSIFTIDGNNYYPAVLHVVPGSPAKVAGVKISDFILAINGTPTVNKSSAEIRALQCGNEGEMLTLRLFRAGKQFDASMIRVNKDKLINTLK
jgi:hypothetical protein